LNRSSPLHIETAITTALAENPDITMAAAAVKKAEADLEKTRALFLPAISLYTDHSAGDAPSAYLFKTIDQRDLPRNTDFNDLGRFSNFETGITMGWNLFRGGKDRLARKMAALNIEGKEALLATGKDRIVIAVIKTYFSLLKAEDYVAIARQSKTTIKEQLRIMEVRFRGGGVLKSDILSLKTRLAEAEKDLVQSQNLHATTAATLANLMGREPLGTITLVKGCSCPVSFPDTYAGGKEIALGSRPELTSARQRLEQARIAVKMAKSDYLPRVDLKSTYYMDSKTHELNANKGNYTVGVRAQWDVFTGFSTKAGIAGAEYQLARARAGMKKTRLAVLRDVKTAFLDLMDANKRFDVAKTATAKAAESFELARLRYQGGSVPITRYLETELAASRAEINLAAARFDKKIAKGEIARALGILSSIWKKE